MTKLTQEQKEELADLAGSEAWHALLALVNIGIEKQQSRLLSADVSKTGREIVLANAKLEGAKDLQTLLLNINEHVGSKKS